MSGHSRWPALNDKPSRQAACLPVSLWVSASLSLSLCLLSPPLCLPASLSPLPSLFIPPPPPPCVCLPLSACLPVSQVGHNQGNHVLSKGAETKEDWSLTDSSVHQHAGEFQALILPAGHRKIGGILGKFPVMFRLFLDFLLLFFRLFFFLCVHNEFRMTRHLLASNGASIQAYGSHSLAVRAAVITSGRFRMCCAAQGLWTGFESSSLPLANCITWHPVMTKLPIWCCLSLLHLMFWSTMGLLALLLIFRSVTLNINKLFGTH